MRFRRVVNIVFFTHGKVAASLAKQTTPPPIVLLHTQWSIHRPANRGRGGRLFWRKLETKKKKVSQKGRRSCENQVTNESIFALFLFFLPPVFAPATSLSSRSFFFCAPPVLVAICTRGSRFARRPRFDFDKVLGGGPLLYATERKRQMHKFDMYAIASSKQTSVFSSRLWAISLFFRKENEKIPGKNCTFFSWALQ